MDRLGDAVTDARDGADEVGAGAQVRVLAEVRHGVTLWLHRVRAWIFHVAEELKARDLKLRRLALALGRDDITRYADGGSGAELRGQLKPRGVFFDDSLKPIEGRAVVNDDKT